MQATEKRKEQMREYIRRTKEIRKPLVKEYYQRNKEYIKNKSKAFRLYNPNYTRDYFRTYFKNRRRTDIKFWMRVNLRDRVIKAFKNFSITGKIRSSDDYGINYTDIINKLILELPKDFDQSLYHIDHKEALCSFDLNDPEEIKKAFAPENHQWLLADDNLKKISKDIELKNMKRKNKEEETK
jgi:hypothetical protein